MGFDANERSIGEIINAGAHIVPRYQRPYAWDEENITDLWNDLRESGDKGHFIGNMVVYSSHADNWDIVDGQQRLTTILIAIRALKDAYEKMHESGRSSGLSGYLQRTDLSGQKTFRLQYRTETGYLHLNILSENRETILGKSPQTASEMAQYQAYKIISKSIDDELYSTPEAKQIEKLDKIRDRFINATVVYVRVDDKQSAFRIFETLNDRGKSLSQIDLVKNQIISAIPASASREDENLWAESLQSIETSSWSKVKSEDFIGYAWNSTANQSDSDIVSTSRIRRSVENYLVTSDSPEDRAADFIRFFHQTAEIFREFDNTLASPNGKHWKNLVPEHRWRPDKFSKIDDALYGCLVPGSNLPLPILFALLRNYIHTDRSAISNAKLLEFLSTIETLQFRWSIAQRPSTSTIRRVYRRAAFAVDSASQRNDINEALSTFKEDARPLMPTDSQFKEGLRKLTYFSQRPHDVHRIRRTLQKVEEEWGKSKLPRNNDPTLEHIEGQGGKSINTRQNFWIGKLGNLMLLPSDINSTLPKEFVDKSGTLHHWANDSDEVLCNQIQAKYWDNSTANSRMEAILDVAVKVWPKEL